MADRQQAPLSAREATVDPARPVLDATLADALSGETTARAATAQSDTGSRRPPAIPTANTPSTPPAGAPVIRVVLTHREAPPGPPGLPFVQNPDSPTAAAFRVLRHKLREVDSPRTIAITSPNAKEGKTACAIALAMALAEHGRAKVLLIEANFRSPHVATSLGFKPPTCFGEQMATHMKTPSAPWGVTAAFFPNLHVLAVDPASVGQWVLNSPAFKSTMDQLHRADYEHVIIDCPHALGSADVNVIEDSADGVLMTAIARRTSAASLQKAARHLSPVNLLGVVLMQR